MAKEPIPIPPEPKLLGIGDHARAIKEIYTILRRLIADYNERNPGTNAGKGFPK